jgi:hypothetical protein
MSEHSTQFRRATTALHAIQPDLETAGLVVEEVIEREPYAPEVEYQSPRAYIFARKPTAAAV